MIIYALPYAAGSAAIYYELSMHLKHAVRFVPLELPGHGRRIGEQRLQSIQEMAKDIFRQLMTNGVHEPYCLMGYSMGSTICYELYQLLRAKCCPLPCHILMCASDIPTHKHEFSNIREMSDSELIEQLYELGGTPQEILENRELLELILPIVRDDFISVEEYCPSTAMKMNCGGTVICGTQELEDEENEFSRWEDFFSQKVDSIRIEGGHFFLHDKSDELAKHIKRVVLALDGGL